VKAQFYRIRQVSNKQSDPVHKSGQANTKKFQTSIRGLEISSLSGMMTDHTAIKTGDRLMIDNAAAWNPEFYIIAKFRDCTTIK